MKSQDGDYYISVEKYLSHEEKGEVRHEYINGTVHAMDGSSANHNLIFLNMAASLRAAAKSTQCQVFIADMKIALIIASEDIFLLSRPLGQLFPRG